MIVQGVDALNRDAFSVEAWIRFEDSSGHQIFLNRGAAGGAFTFYKYQDHLRMLVEGPDGYSYARGPVPPDGRWFHCVGTYSADGTKRLFIDGELVGEEAGEPHAIESEAPLTIGAMRASRLGRLQRPFHGRLENIRLWDRALTHREVRERMRTPPAREEMAVLRDNGLLAYWAERSREEGRVADLSGHGRHAQYRSGRGDPVVIETRRADGYQGIWYSNQPSDDRYRYKYSGGLGTYCAKHRHHAQYVPEEDKTFFVYGGTQGVDEPNALQIMVSYYDHATGRVPKPAIIMDKGTSDAHHNPVLAIDGKGHLWVFASAHGGDDGFIWKSTQPYSLDRFRLITQKEFTYPQPRYIEGEGFLFLFTKYTAGREMYFTASTDGDDWHPDRKIAGFGGHYQISEQHGRRRGTAFNWHPPEGGLNARTQLYYMESDDLGETWTTVDGTPLDIPLRSPDNPALIHDFQDDGWLVYLKDIAYDSEGRPAILVVLSRGYASGPDNDPRIWTLVRWTGERWEHHEVARSDHNYDTGALYLEEPETWRVVAPTAPGPQEYGTGGEMEMWISRDTGQSWSKHRALTQESEYNHTYARRPVRAHPEFFAFWADGNALEKSPSRLYFCDQAGANVWRLPPEMETSHESPEPVR